MTHLSLSQSFLVPVSRLAVSLQPASPLSPSFSPPPQHLASLQPTIILTLMPVPLGSRDGGGGKSRALFRFEIFLNFDILVFLFLFDKHCLIIE